VDLGARGLEREREARDVHVLEEILDAPVVHAQQVLKGDHAAADLPDKLGLLGPEALEDGPFRGARDLIEQAGDEGHAVGLPDLGTRESGDPTLEGLLHLLNDLRVRGLHDGQPPDHLLLPGDRHGLQDLPRLDGSQVRKDEGNHLRVFVSDEVDHARGVGPFKKLEVGCSDGGVVDLAGQVENREVAKDLLSLPLFGRGVLQTDDLPGDPLLLPLVKPGHEPRGGLLVERDQEDRRPAGAGVDLVLGSGHDPSPTSRP
jgi:hypothetical protein